MIIDSITLHNYGIYKGKNTFNLNPENKKPIILIGGLNGHGKTTLLEALQIGFFGRKLTDIYQSKKLSYEEFIKKTINKDSDSSLIQINFHQIEKGEIKNYAIYRTWSRNSKPLEKFDILVDSKKDDVIKENWSTLVEDFIPANVSSFFFFDGEKIEEYADIENSKKIFKKSIKKLLGLDIVDLLSSHINQMLAENADDGGENGDNLNTEIEIIEKKIGDLEEIKDNLEDQLSLTKTELQNEKNICEELNSQFKETGGSQLAKQQEYNSLLSHSKNVFALEEQKINQMAIEEAPLALAYPLLTSLMNELESNKKSYDENILNKKINEKYKKLLEDNKKNFDQKNFNIFKSILENDLKAFRQDEMIDSFDNVLFNDLANFYYNEYPDFMSELKKNITNYQKSIEDVIDAEKKELDLNFEDNIIDLKDKIVKSEKILLQKEQEITKIEKEITKNKFAIEVERRNLNKFIDKLQNLQKKDENQIRMNLHGPKVQETLNLFKEKVINHKLNKIENFILDTFNQLMNKKNFIEKVVIDRETNELNLFDQKNRKIDLQKLSAGERQLLAVSMIWSFSKASHKNLPTIIDTPLGRLDSKHRVHLVNNYFPKAGEQVLLLSTDEEIDTNLKTKLDKYISRSYHLDYNAKTQTTSIKEGYFH